MGYRENLEASIAQHQRQVDAGTPEAPQAQQIINQFQAELSRISTPATSSPVASSPTPANSPPAPAPTPPNPWVTTSSYIAPTGIKQADPDIVLDPDIVTSGDYITERFFEELGGTELINLSRHDLIDGIGVSYSPIANLSRLRQRFNPNNIIATDAISDNEFAKSSIDLVSRGMSKPYFDDEGNLIAKVDIIRLEENIEVEISQSGTLTRIIL